MWENGTNQLKVKVVRLLVPEIGTEQQVWIHLQVFS